jgi:hypothetical protein
MKAVLLGLVTLVIWALVFDQGLDQFEADLAERARVDACLFEGGTPLTCTR